MTQKLTKEQAIVITGFTGVLACGFSYFHEDVEKRMGRPVFTHEIVSLRGEIEDLYRADFLALCFEEK